MHHQVPVPPTLNPTGNEFPNLLQNDRLLVKMPTLQIITQELRLALKLFTEHSLTHSAKWYNFMIALG